MCMFVHRTFYSLNVCRNVLIFPFKVVAEVKEPHQPKKEGGNLKKAINPKGFPFHHFKFNSNYKKC